MGATYLCYQLKVLGVDVTGGMQEYWAVPAARLLKLPDSVSDHDAPLIEPLIGLLVGNLVVLLVLARAFLRDDQR